MTDNLHISLTCISRDEVERVEGEVITAVDINGLQQPEEHPRPEEEDVVGKEEDSKEEATS